MKLLSRLKQNTFLVRNAKIFSEVCSSYAELQMQHLTQSITMGQTTKKTPENWSKASSLLPFTLANYSFSISPVYILILPF